MMPVTRENLARHELIGLQAKVLNSSEPSMLGVHGRVVDETKEVVKIVYHGEAKSVPKSTSVFLFSLPGGEEVKVEGKEIVGRPEDRIRKSR